MTTSRIDKIKERSLSATDRRNIDALASRTIDPEIPEDAMPQPPAAPAPKPEKPNSIEDIAKVYFITFREDKDDATAAALTQAAMQLEGAALIAKAIRESK